MVMADSEYLILMPEILRASRILKVLACVLLDIDDFTTLINYFKSLYDNWTGSFELRGVRFTQLCVQSSATENFFNAPSHTSDQSEMSGKGTEDDPQSKNCLGTNLNANTIIVSRCCALSSYCICFSIIKACKYWNSDTLDSLSEHGNIFYAQSLNKECPSINDLPASLQIYDADIRVQSNLKKQGKLCCTSEASK